MVVCPRDSDDPVNWHGFVCAVPFENKAERATWLSVHSGHCGFDILIDGAWPSPDHLREYLRGIVYERRQQEEFERQKRNWERTGRYS
jgi:hypothetical protein